MKEGDAPEGYLWVCMACGKAVKNKYGEKCLEWDESCFVNSYLIKESMLVWDENKTKVVEILHAE